jgi:Rieske Fe-S protein
VFYADGGYAAGPAPRGLYEMKYKIEGENLIALVGHLPTLQDPGSANVMASQT